MGFWSSVGSAISSACSSACSAVGSAFSSAASLIREVGSMAVEGLRSVANVICNIGKALGFMEQDEDPEDYGDKVLQAEEMGITLDSCDNDYDAYMEKIKNFKVDSEKSKTFSTDDKLRAASVVVGAKIEDHYGTSIGPLVPLMARLPEFFNGGRLKGLLDAGMSVNKISDYFSSNLNRKEAAPVEADLIKQESKSALGNDESQFRDMLRSMRE
jgi:hypothetical protein